MRQTGVKYTAKERKQELYAESEDGDTHRKRERCTRDVRIFSTPAEKVLFSFEARSCCQLRQGGKGGLVVDVDGDVGAVLASATGSTTATGGATPVSTVLATVATATSATTTVWTVEASFDFEVDFVFLLGTSLGGGLAL